MSVGVFTEEDSDNGGGDEGDGISDGDDKGEKGVGEEEVGAERQMRKGLKKNYFFLIQGLKNNFCHFKKRPTYSEQLVKVDTLD